MKRRMWLAGVLAALLWAAPARADNSFIVRSTLSLQALQTACSPPLLPSICTVFGGLGDPLGQLFLITSPLDLTGLLNLVGNPLGIVDAEVNQLLSLIGSLNLVPTPISSTLMQDRSSTAYPAGSTQQTACNSHVNQPAASIVGVQNAQKAFNVTGNGIVADIDTGVDPTHPVLQPVLVPGDGYDFTRNQPGGSELNDLSPCPFPSTSPCTPPPCSSTACPSPAQVNQSSAAILDQSSAAILDGNSQYKAFGHGTMVMGIIHLVAPTAMLMPLKAFHSDGTASLSDILRAIYYGVQNNANVINMSFDTKTSSAELQKALDYANQQGIICAASAGNDGQGPPLLVYPAALQNDVMGVASTSNTDTRSSFSNYGDAIVWVAAPGEAIVTTYPFSTYSAGWGTSFSAPFVSGGAALLRNLRTDINESSAASAVAHAQFVGADLGNGRLDLLMALAALPAGGASPDYSVSVAPSSTTIASGEDAKFTVSAAPSGGFNQMVSWSCSGAPPAATCTVSPSSVTLDGTNAANATVSLTTTTRAFSSPLAIPRFVPPLFPWGILLLCAALLLVSLILHNSRFAERSRPWLIASTALALAVPCTSCSGGASSNPQPAQGTPANTYTITVTGSSSNLSHAATFKLTVK